MKPTIVIGCAGRCGSSALGHALAAGGVDVPYSMRMEAQHAQNDDDWYAYNDRKPTMELHRCEACERELVIKCLQEQPLRVENPCGSMDCVTTFHQNTERYAGMAVKIIVKLPWFHLPPGYDYRLIMLWRPYECIRQSWGAMGVPWEWEGDPRGFIDTMSRFWTDCPFPKIGFGTEYMVDCAHEAMGKLEQLGWIKDAKAAAEVFDPSKLHYRLSDLDPRVSFR